MVAARSRALSLSYLEALPSTIPPIFEQVQHTTANHRKNVVALRKIQDAAASLTESTPKGTKLIGEKAFTSVFVDMVNRVLGVKKGVAVADRVIKFVASYVAYTTEQDLANRPEGEEDIDTASTRFVVKLLKHLLSGMEAKDKNVRYRVTLLTVNMINGLGEMDDDLYVLLRESLLDRARDKESAVRVQAALGLAKLQSGEDEEDLEEGQESLMDVLLELLRYDPAAEVRRAALYNLPRTPALLPHIIARTRDVDPMLRKAVFAGSLSAVGLPDARALSIAQREEVVRNGLGDREPGVRKAAASMLGGWVDHCGGDLLEFLSRFDVVSSEVAEEALISVFVTRPEVFAGVEFSDEYWASLTPEKAFLARIFVEHCISEKDEARLEDTLPVVTALAFRIQDEYNKLVGAVNGEGEDATEQAFVVGELLRLAVSLDYSDEIGRRKMFQLAREMLSQSNLPEQLIPKCIDVLSKIADGERDLIRVVVDVVTELREGDGDEEQLEPPTPSSSSVMETPRPKPIAPRFNLDDPEERMQAALIDLRCLLICISLLERVNSTLQDNSVFHGLLPDLIIPAVRNKEEPALRDQGLICLGLCCMIDSKMAANSFGLFVQQLAAADDQLKVKIVQIVFDLFMVQDIQDLVSKTMPVDQVNELVRHMLAQDAPEVQAAACEGAAKLMLAGMISEESILQSLVLLYFSPETADNQSLRQCLTYFLPIYCYSAPENQRRMLSIFMETFAMLSQLHEEVEDEADMPPLSQMGLMLVDWLDPQKTAEREGIQPDQKLHLDLGVGVLKGVLTESTREGRKTLVSFLSKLYLPEPEDADAVTVKSLAALLGAVRDKRPFSDLASKNAVNRFEAALTKRYLELLQGFDDDAFRGEGESNPQIAELFGFIDDVPEIDDTVSEAGSSRPRGSRRGSRQPSTKGRSRRGTTAVSESDPEDDQSTVAGASDEETPRKSVPIPPPRQKNPGREARSKRMQSVIEEDEEEGEEGEEGDEVDGMLEDDEGDDSFDEI